MDPRTKIILTIVVSIMVFWEHQNIIFICTLAAIPIVLLFSIKKYKTIAVYSILFAIALSVRLLQNIDNVPYLVFTIGGMIVWLVLRLFPSFLLADYLIESTKASEFVAAMQKWKVPDSFVIPVAVVFRFVPTIKTEYRSISYAMKMRGIRFGNKNFFEYSIIPLIMSVVKIGEELSAAALTKGLGKYNERSSIGKLVYTKYDFAVYILCVGLIIWVTQL